VSARENTLLAQLGFKDPDRAEPMHDLACRYTRKHAWSVLTLAKFPERYPDLRKEDVSAECEFPVVKGTGKYRSVVGFLDVAILAWGGPILGVEVKTTPVGVGEILRQIRLYQEFVRDGERLPFVVVTTYKPEISFLEELRDHGIRGLSLDTTRALS